MKWKINLRLTIITLIAVVSTAIGVTMVYYNMFQHRVQLDLQTNAGLLRDTGLFEILYSGEKIGESALDKLQKETLRITWIDSDGEVLFDNDQNAEDLTNHMDRPEIIAAFETGSGESIRKSDTMNMNTFYYALLLDNGTVLRVSTKASSISRVFVAALPTILVISAGTLALCLVLGYMLTASIIRPIDQMAENIDHLEKPPYKELQPFADKIRNQHDNILEAAKVRQDFTANVSHELKTPLTAISGYAELLENHMIEPGNEDHIVGQIRQNAERLLALINDIIQLSELDHKEAPRQYLPIDLYEVAEKCRSSLAVNAEKKSVNLVLLGTHVILNADYDLIHELLTNLVQNAIQYNNHGGYVKIEVGSEKGHVFVSVQDDGIGIPKEHQERIFERFYRVDKSRSRETGGTGLGLAIVKHIAELHDAEITLTSELGQGTMIRVSF